MSDNFDRFSYKHRLPDGSAVFGAPHELHNEVLLVLPEHYFGEGNPWPAWVDVPNFAVEPGTQEAPSAIRIGTEIHMAVEAAIRDLPPAEFRARIEEIVRNYNPGPRDRSGIAADDDPSRHPGEDVIDIARRRDKERHGRDITVKAGVKPPLCDGCKEPTWYLEPREVLPPGKPLDEVKVLDLCEACVEIAEEADPVTGSYGAASAELIIADRVRGIQK